MIRTLAGGFVFSLLATMLGAEEKKPADPPPKEPVASPKAEGAEKPLPARAPVAAELLTGQTKFAETLYAPLAKEAKGNLAFSPFSISQALGLLAEGARGDSLSEMEAALQIKLAAPQRHAAIAGLNWELSRGSKDGNELAIANGLWGQPEKRFEPEFLRVGREFYRAELQPADFARQAEAERKAINAWVAQATREKIPEVLPPGSLDLTTRLVLANAIYLKANWASPFDPKKTKEVSFRLSAEKSVPVPMMYQEGLFSYAETAAGQMAALPYVGGELEMLLFLPRPGKTPDEFLREVPFSAIDKAFASQGKKKTPLKLSLPRFEMKWEGSIKPMLVQLGIRQVFARQGADLTGLDASDELFLADVFHSAKVEVNEEGTVAAAATAGVVKSRSVPKFVEMKIDRPFAFVIRHASTGTILFVGRVQEPGAARK